FDVIPYYFKFRHFLNLPFLVKRADLVFIWFASYHAFITILVANLFKKPKVVVVGGYDASNIKGYGIFSSWIGRKMGRYIYRNSDRIFVVDESLKKDIIANSKLNEIAKKIGVIPTGYDPHRWYPAGEKEKMVLTVCYVNESNWWRKGLNTFMKAAELLPDVPFYVVGKMEERLKNMVEQAGDNVTFTGWVSDNQLLHLYQKAKVYCQISKYEGLPNVLCEAMLCKCVPVGTDILGVKTAIGSTGFYVSYGDEEATVEAIKKALYEYSDLGKRARERIIAMFSPEMREQLLVEQIMELVGDKNVGN
ncbi:MAG: glycosyltransferase family 4 protein, partial [Candidatus Cloacimonadia bacterium]